MVPINAVNLHAKILGCLTRKAGSLLSGIHSGVQRVIFKIFLFIKY